MGTTTFRYTVSSGRGTVNSFLAGIPSCPEFSVVGKSRYVTGTNSHIRGIRYTQTVQAFNTYTYTVTVNGIVQTTDIPYAINGNLPNGLSGSKHAWSHGTVLGPKCEKTPIISCDLSKQRYIGECIGNTVRIPLMTHSKYHTKLRWSTAYAGCSFTQINTVHPTIAFHGPICDTEFRVKLELWGQAKQYIFCYAIIYATDTTPPTFAGMYGPGDETTECDDIPAPSQVFAKDNCDNNVQVEFSENRERVAYGPYTIYREWVATDDCGNKATYTQAVRVQDTQKPELIGVPQNEVVQCNSEVEPCVVTAIDNCDDVTVDFSEDIEEGSCVDQWKIIRKWSASDSSHNTATAVQTVSVTDTVPPTIVGIPDDLSVECDAVPANVVPSVTDNCDDDLSISYTEQRIDSTCDHEYEIQRTYSVVDDCGNVQNEAWNVQVYDTIPPTLGGSSSGPETVPCDNIPLPCIVEASDNCKEYEISVVPTDQIIVDNCPNDYSILYTWTAEDDCGNSNTLSKVLVVQDNEDPKFTQHIPDIIRSDCEAREPIDLTATDNCGDVTVTHTWVKNGGDEVCEFIFDIVHTWTASDECGRVSYAYQTVRVSDTTPPVLIGGPPDLSLPCEDPIPEFAVTAYDNCDCVGDPKKTKIGSGGTKNCDEWQVFQWRVEDCCGLYATHVHTVYFYDDVPPILRGVPTSRYLNIEDIHDIDPNPIVTVEDNCDQHSHVEKDSDQFDGTCPHNYKIIRSWWSTDDCGNKASISQTIYCDDTEPPIFINPNYQSNTVCDNPIYPIIQCSDNGGGYSVHKDEQQRTVPGTCDEEYSVIRDFTCTDVCGNSVEKTYTVHVFDTSPPTWTTLPHQTEELVVRNTREQYAIAYVDNVTAYDICAGDLPVKFEETVKETSCSNEYTIIRVWTTSDDCGNSLILRRTIEVRDQEDPELLNVPPHTTIDCTEDVNGIYTDPVAVDYGYDGSLVVTASTTVLWTSECEHNVTLLKCWRVHDCVGHDVKECQTVEIRDHQPPSWVYLPPNKVVPCEDVPVKLDPVTATDECGHAHVTMSEYVKSGTCENEYTLYRTWVATDDCDLSITHVQTIEVVDNELPTFTKIPEMMVLECEEFAPYTSAICEDNCDLRTRMRRGGDAKPGTCLGNTITIRQWFCEDNCGNIATAEQWIRFRDTTPPRFNFQPQDLSLPCANENVIPPEPTHIRAIDDCDSNPDLSFQEFLKPGAYGFQSSENYRVWIATDDCGNTAEMQQTIIVYDNIPPVVTVPSSPAPVECPENEVALDFLEVTDNCDPDPTVDLDVSVDNMGYCPTGHDYQKTYKWCPRDKSGNVGQCRTAVVVVADTTLPVWSHSPSNRKISYESQDRGHDSTLVCTDNCGGTHITMDTNVLPGDCPNEETIIYNYVCSDICGHSIHTSQTIYVIDDVDPPLEPLPVDLTVECGYGSLPDPDILQSNDPYSSEHLKVTFTETALPTSCDQEIVVKRTWWVSDCAGNMASHDQTVGMYDTEDPELPAQPDVTYECEHQMETYVPVIAYDKCDSAVDVVYSSTPCAEDFCHKEFCREWTATDDCGNTVTEYQTVYIIDDTPPVVNGNADDITVDNHNIPINYKFQCSDACYTDIVMANYNEESNGGSCPEEFTLTRTWTCTDVCGRDKTLTQIITILDNEIPIISYCPQDITVQVGLVPPMPTITATDNQVYGEVTVYPDEDEELFYQQQIMKKVYRSWTAKDNCENLAECKQTITVIDTIPPIIPDVPRDDYLDCDDLILSSQEHWKQAYLLITRQLESTIADSQITIVPSCVSAEDYEHCDPFPFVKVEGTCKNEYTVKRTWTATDHAGNSLSDSQIITVVDDKPPTLHPIPPPTITYDCHHEPAPEVTAKDNCDIYVEEPDYKEKKHKGSCLEDYYLVRHWSATDRCGNSVSASQTVWVSDSEGPTMESPQPDFTMPCDEYNGVPPPDQLSCSDNCDGVYGDHHVQAVATSQKLPGTCADSWVFVYTWRCEDRCGGGVVKRQTIEVHDLTPPEFENYDDDTLTINCDDSTPIPEIDATDNCADYVEVHYSSSGRSSDYLNNEFIQTWTATDHCGNRNSKERTVTVIDPADPVIVPRPPSRVIPCEDYGDFEIPTVKCEDNCGTPDLQRTVLRIDGTCDSEYTIVVTWTCTDPHDNVATHEMSIDVVDNEGPTISDYSTERTVPCIDVPPAPTAVASDNCEEVQVLFNENKHWPEYSTGDIAFPISFAWAESKLLGRQHPKNIRIVDRSGTFGTTYYNPALRSPNDAELADLRHISSMSGGQALTYQGVNTYQVCVNWVGHKSMQAPVGCAWWQPPSTTTVPGQGGEPIEIPVRGKCHIFMNTQNPACSKVVSNYWKTDAPMSTLFGRWVFPQTTSPVNSFNYRTDPMIPSLFSSFPALDVYHDNWVSYSIDPRYHNSIDDLPVWSMEDLHPCDRYVLTRTWTATDSCGHSATAQHKITVWDDEAPVISRIPQDITIDCIDGESSEYQPIAGDYPSADHGIRAPLFFDVCDENVVMKETEATDFDGCISNSVTTYTWTATDACGQVSTASMKMTKQDITPPEIPYTPPYKYYECEAPFLPDDPFQFIPDVGYGIEAVDECNDVTTSFSWEQKATGCNASYVWKWTAVDECGNSATKTSLVFIYDTTPPQFPVVPPDVTVDCEDDDYIPPTPTATDPHDCNTVTVSKVLHSTYNDCPSIKEEVYTWIAVDDCGNRATATTTVSTHDTSPPVISGVPDDRTDECETDYVPVNVVCDDDCGDGVLTMSYDVVDYDCEATGIYYVQYRHWVCHDICGNRDEEALTIVVKDVSPPVINLPSDTEIPCDATISYAEATASDECGMPELTSSKKTIPGTCEDQYDVVATWVAVDDCGLVTTKDHTISVTDTSDPTLSPKPTDTDVDCAQIPIVPVVQAKDDCSYPTVKFSETNDREGYDCNSYTIVRHWFVADDCGNSDSHSQTIGVTDSTGPSLLCNGLPDCEDMVIECEFYPPLPVVVAADDCYEHTEAAYTATPVTGSCAHDHEEIREWTTHDGCGHVATVQQTIQYIDNTEPEFSGECEDETIECTETSPLPVLTCDDNCDYALELDYTYNRHSDSCHQIYIEDRRWECTDLCGHSASMTQRVTVEDNEAPTFSYIPVHAKIECHLLSTVWVDGITASDNCEYDISIKFLERKVNGSCDDTYTLIRSWSASDCSGNTVQHEQTISVVDTIPPSFNNYMPEDSTVSLDDIYEGAVDLNPPSLTATDNCAEPSVVFKSVDVPMDYDCDYITYRIWTWTATDDCGNVDSLTQTIEMQRTTLPVFESIDDITVQCDEIPQPCDPQLIDSDSYDVTITFHEYKVTGSCDDTYTLHRKWTATDCAYNSATLDQLVYVVDTTPPMFSRTSEEITVSCGCEFPAVPDIDAIDNCDTDITESYSETEGEFECNSDFYITRTWTAEDDCGNIASVYQQIHVIDKTPPDFCENYCDEEWEGEYDVISCLDTDLALDPVNPVVRDECDDDVEVTKSSLDEVRADVCDAEVTWTYTATDDCGNSRECTRTFNIADNEPPICRNCEQLCFPLTGYGPTETEYAKYPDVTELFIDVVDECNTHTVQYLHCNSTQAIVNSDCLVIPGMNALYVRMEADADDFAGRHYYVWFNLIDDCGNDRIVSRTIWVPQSADSYHLAVSDGLCPHGLGTDLFYDGLPVSQNQ